MADRLPHEVRKQLTIGVEICFATVTAYYSPLTPADPSQIYDKYSCGHCSRG